MTEQSDDVLDRLRRLDSRKLKEVLVHYEDIFGEVPNFAAITSGQEMPKEFWGNLQTLVHMLQVGKARPCKKCPTCQEIMSRGGEGRSAPHDMEPSVHKAAGRYSEALDAQLDLLNYWSRPGNRGLYEDVLTDNGMNRGRASLMLDLIIDALAVAEPFYVTPIICNLLFDAAKSIPRSWTLAEHTLYVPAGFVWLGAQYIPSEGGPVVAMVWATMAAREGRYILPSSEDSGERVAAIGFFYRVTGWPMPLPAQMSLWKFGGDLQAPIEGGYNPEVADQERCQFATLMTFLQQRILVSPKFVADRVARRRVERAARKPPTKEIRVIALRRVERRTGEAEQRDVEWTCQWIVRGHWRNQWHPRPKHYQPKWIVPYVKGPEDKPLRNPGRLFTVVR